MDCPVETRARCLAYQYQMGQDYWFIWHINKNSVAGRIGDGCFHCPWFNRNNPKIDDSNSLESVSTPEEL